MITRTSSTTVTFAHPFALAGAGERPAGTYSVETEEELLPTSAVAYRRVATWLRVTGELGTMRAMEIIRVDPDELTKLLASDAARIAAQAAETTHVECCINDEETAMTSWLVPPVVVPIAGLLLLAAYVAYRML